MVLHSRIPSAWKVDAGGSGVRDQLQLHTHCVSLLGDEDAQMRAWRCTKCALGMGLQGNNAGGGHNMQQRRSSGDSELQSPANLLSVSLEHACCDWGVRRWLRVRELPHASPKLELMAPWGETWFCAVTLASELSARLESAF